MVVAFSVTIPSISLFIFNTWVDGLQEGLPFFSRVELALFLNNIKLGI